MKIRTAQIETDVAGIARLCTVCDPHQPTAEGSVRRWFENNEPGRVTLRQVMVDESEAIHGYAVSAHETWMPRRHFYSWVGVDPACRCQGLGSALLEAALEFLNAQGATRITSEVKDDDPLGLAFARRRGFTIDRQLFDSVLDLTAFDEAPYLPKIAALQAEGIRFCLLSDLPDNAETLQKYYELNLAVARDIPGEVWDFDAYPSFFEKNIINAPWFRRENQILALEGERFAGFAALSFKPQERSAYNATTGVTRPYRGRGIGLALKVLAARLARCQGADYIRTDNDSTNAPILAINRKMGYQPQPGRIMLVRWLQTE